MYELITIDPATGDEEDLLGTGTWDEMAEAMAEAAQDDEDAGGDGLWMRVQPAQ